MTVPAGRRALPERGSASVSTPVHLVEDSSAELRALVEHRPSHDEVLSPLAARGPDGTCDGVIVPTSRGIGAAMNGLRAAASVARFHRCPLVLIVSADAASGPGREQSAKVLAHESDGDVSPVYVDVDSLPVDVLRLETDSTALATRAWSSWPGRGDTSVKRNLGLLLAARQRWRTLLFLDDDVAPLETRRPGAVPLTGAGVGRAVGALEHGAHAAVGWAAVDDGGHGCPDNSLVCRLRRQVGYQQGVFVGGGALALRVKDAPCFPRIYNEDWMLALQLLHRGGVGAVGIAGHVRQDMPESVFDTFRARMEEPGDILAEALMNVVTRPREFALAAVDTGFWRAAIERRIQMVRELAPLLDEGIWRVRRSGDRDSAREALRVTQDVHVEMRAEIDGWSVAFRDYVRAWSGDSVRWRHLLDEASVGRLPADVERLLPDLP
jgi:hypothetical protein